MSSLRWVSPVASILFRNLCVLGRLVMYIHGDYDWLESAARIAKANADMLLLCLHSSPIGATGSLSSGTGGTRPGALAAMHPFRRRRGAIT